MCHVAPNTHSFLIERMDGLLSCCKTKEQQKLLKQSVFYLSAMKSKFKYITLLQENISTIYQHFCSKLGE